MSPGRLTLFNHLGRLIEDLGRDRDAELLGRQKANPRDFRRLLCFGWQRCGEQSEDKSTNKPDGPELHNGLLKCYEGTNITGERVVNPHRTQLNDALKESYVDECF